MLVKRLVLIGFLLVSGMVAAKGITYTLYENGSAEFVVAIPDILYGQGESQNGLSQVFKSADMDAVLVVDGIGNPDEKIIDDLYYDALNPDDKKERVFIYHTMGNDWFVVTGFHKDKVFYQKTILSESDGHIKTIYFTYPKAKKAFYDKITTKIAQSFKNM